MCLALGLMCSGSSCHFSFRCNPCFCTRKLAIEVTNQIVSIYRPFLADSDGFPELDTIYVRFLCMLVTELRALSSNSSYSRYLPFLSEFQSCVAGVTLQHIAAVCERSGLTEEGLLLVLLDSPVYEVVCIVLDALLDWTEGVLAANR